MNTSARKGRRVLAVLAVVDFLSGLFLVVWAADVAIWLDIDHRGVVRALGVGLMALAVSGAWFSQRQPPSLNRGLMLQAIANLVWAACVLAALLVSPDAAGVIALVVVAVLAVAVAAYERRLAKKAHR